MDLLGVEGDFRLLRLISDLHWPINANDVYFSYFIPIICLLFVFSFQDNL